MNLKLTLKNGGLSEFRNVKNILEAKDTNFNMQEQNEIKDCFK